MTTTDKKYVTTEAIDGDVYTDIADTLTIMGYPMNHCTARAIVIRVMERLVKRIVENIDGGTRLCLDKTEIRRIAASPQFQASVMQIMDKIEFSCSKGADDDT